MVKSAARVVAAKTSSTPSPVKLEHCKYCFAPHYFASSDPCLGLTNSKTFFLISSIANWFSLRSFFSPTSIIATLGQFSLASSSHFCLTFLKLTGLSTLNANRTTCAFKYVRYRSSSQSFRSAVSHSASCPGRVSTRISTTHVVRYRVKNMTDPAGMTYFIVEIEMVSVVGIRSRIASTCVYSWPFVKDEAVNATRSRKMNQ